MKDEILIVFETNKVVTKEILNDAIGLKRSDCIIVTLDEVVNYQVNPKEYFAILDGTVNNKIIQMNKEKGVLLKENGIPFLQLTQNNVFVVPAPNISQLTALHFDSSERSRSLFQDAIKEYDNKINFLKNKNVKLRTKNDFQQAYPTTGIILNPLMEENNGNLKKVYKLIKDIPEQKETNVEYLTLEHLEILHDIEKLLHYIK